MYQTKLVGIILKTSNLVSELLDSHCNIANHHLRKKYFTINKWRLLAQGRADYSTVVQGKII